MTFLIPVNNARWQPARSRDSSATSLPIYGGLRTKSHKDSKVPLHKKSAFDLAKDFLISILYIENPWLASQENELDICDKAQNEVLNAITVQQRGVGALNGMQHMWECPTGPIEYIDALTGGIVSF